MHRDLFRVILFGKSTFDESYTFVSAPECYIINAKTKKKSYTYTHVYVYIDLIFYCRLNQNDVFMVFFSFFTTWNQR